MKLIIYKQVKGFKNYQVSNYGDVFNTKTCKFISGHKIYNGGILISFSSGNKTKKIMLHKLVWKHFKKSQLGKKWIHHLDFNKENNYTKNLDKLSRGDHKRIWNEYRNKIRGVYKFNHAASKKNWRAVLKINNKVKTLGYYKTRREAVFAYWVGYTEVYKRPPFEL